MVDINTHWDLSTALRWGPELDRYDIDWLEEPINQHDVKGHAQLQALMRAPLLVGENLTSLTLFRDFFEQRALASRSPTSRAWAASRAGSTLPRWPARTASGSCRRAGTRCRSPSSWPPRRPRST